MLINFFLLILGFVLLIKGADFFVDGASSTAKNLKVSKSIIGLTIVALGTSLPEFAISMKALANNSSDMVLGDVIGSNVLNILLILGVAAIINPLVVKKKTLQKELPLVMLISTLLVVLFLDINLTKSGINQITRADGIVILLFFTIFIYYLVSIIKQKKKDNDDSLPKYNLIKSLLFIVLGLIGIIIGSNFVVNNATIIAKTLGVSERVISLTIIAFGTSLPELVTTIVSSLKKEQDLLLGNIIGSNIFNICVVLGIPVTIYGVVSPTSFQYVDLIMLIGSSILLYVCAKSQSKITRREGILMVLTFAVYYVVLIFS